MKTILLDRTTWDLVLDAGGNIAAASDPYSQAQDAASAIKTFQGEVYYDTTLGVPYWSSILGKRPPFSFLKAKFAAAAMTVPGVSAAVCFINAFTDRVISGQVQIRTSSGSTSVATF